MLLELKVQVCELCGSEVEAQAARDELAHIEAVLGRGRMVNAARMGRRIRHLTRMAAHAMGIAAVLLGVAVGGGLFGFDMGALGIDAHAILADTDD